MNSAHAATMRTAPLESPVFIQVVTWTVQDLEVWLVDFGSEKVYFLVLTCLY